MGFYKSGTGDEFVNQTLVGTATLITPPSANRLQDYIGYDLYGRYAQMLVHEIIVYNTALSATSRRDRGGLLESQVWAMTRAAHDGRFVFCPRLARRSRRTL